MHVKVSKNVYTVMYSFYSGLSAVGVLFSFINNYTYVYNIK